MAVEKKWLAVTATPFTADGTQFGVVTIADTNGYKVKGYVFISANTLPTIQLQVQRVTSPTTMIVGPPGTTPQVNHYTNISAYTVALNAMVGFPEQDKNKIKADDIDQAVYEGDPTVAIRTIPVDPYGNLYGPDYPMPVSATITPTPGTIPTVWTNIELFYDANNNLTLVQYYNGVSVERTLTLTYDSNNNLIDVLPS